MDVGLSIFIDQDEVLRAIETFRSQADGALDLDLLLPGNIWEQAEEDLGSQLTRHLFAKLRFTLRPHERDEPQMGFSVHWRRPESRTLLLLELGARSDDRELIAHARTLKRVLSRGALATVACASPEEPSAKRPARHFRCTQGAIRLFRQGWAWRQAGSNAIFMPSDVAPLAE